MPGEIVVMENVQDQEVFGQVARCMGCDRCRETGKSIPVFQSPEFIKYWDAIHQLLNEESSGYLSGGDDEHAKTSKEPDARNCRISQSTPY